MILRSIIDYFTTLIRPNDVLLHFFYGTTQIQRKLEKTSAQDC